MKISDRGLWIESQSSLSDSPLWTVPLRLIEAVATGKPAQIGAVPPRLANHLTAIREIYAAWVEGGVSVPLLYDEAPLAQAPPRGVSLFFSSGVDSFYSLVKHRDEIDHLILIHGFDIPLAETKVFAAAEAVTREAARIFDKKTIVVRTNLHWEESQLYTGKARTPCAWGMYHGAALAAVAHALAPVHRKVFIASSYSYTALHPWGSHPLLDPLWSTETLEIVHDGGERRMDKLQALIGYPEVLANLRVCWENLGANNCGRCEKCVRTMLGLRALGVESCPAFPGSLTPALVSSQPLNSDSAIYWRELLDADLSVSLKAAVQSAVSSYAAGLPPRTGKPKREIKRKLYAMRNAAKALRAAI
jgi:hypothetical protein